MVTNGDNVVDVQLFIKNAHFLQNNRDFNNVRYVAPCDIVLSLAQKITLSEARQKIAKKHEKLQHKWFLKKKNVHKKFIRGKYIKSFLSLFDTKKPREIVYFFKYWFLIHNNPPTERNKKKELK